ncbi:MAG TPA: ATP-dependent Clp protease ATP-binding subunit, partial [Patescibacteria group bacterium]|nr:ATP-dependent Clp protease ATP-binding subunit [Patescibacteria group bacterium]
MNADILEKFTTHLRNTLARCIDLAWEQHVSSIPPLFLLIGVSEQRNSVGARVLRKHHISSKVLLQYMPSRAKEIEQASLNSIQQMPQKQSVEEQTFWPLFSQEAQIIIEQAALTALQLHHRYIGTEHLLLALVQRSDATIQKIFQEHKVTPDVLHQQLSNAMNSTSKFAEVQSLFNASQSQQKGSTAHVALGKEKEPESTTPALDFFGTDLTSVQITKKLDPVIGRAKEIQRMMHILSRRSKNNPILIGEAGVGKTAIVEGLAKRIASSDVPDVLLHKRIIAIDMGSIIAGTMYRGDFEARIKQLIEEVKAHPDIILFIDEIHTLVGTGGVNGGTLDAANILKPALAKGEIRCIGATTADEYRKHIEHDPALERRFQPISVAEPSADESIEILSGLRKQFEEFHHVDISDEVIKIAVQLSVRFLPERRLPDKAIDLLDEAGARTHVHRSLPPLIKKFNICTRMLLEVQQQKDHAVRTEQFQIAMGLKQKEDSLTKKLHLLKQQLKKSHIPRVVLTTNDVAEVVSAMTTIPLEHIIFSQQKRVANIQQQMREHIVGQDEAIQMIANVLKRSYAGLSSPHKPLGTFLFLGPSGVGKTECAKVLAERIFGSRAALIRVDMSEFSENFTISKLIGAPAGYVGHNERNPFVDQIRRKPYSVVLFDEIEKAHPDIFGLLLQILDDGRLTDSAGRELNFRNCIIILTSNIGVERFNKQAEIGFETEKKKIAAVEFKKVTSTILQELPDFFPQEFLNRIHHHIVFHPLSEKDIEHIIDAQFRLIQQHVHERGITLRLLASARTCIAKKSFNPQEGARRIQRMLA